MSDKEPDLETQKAAIMTSIKSAGPLVTEIDQKQLADLLRVSAFRKLLCGQLMLSDELMIMLCNIDLTKDEEVKRAIALQARMQSTAYFVEEIVTLALKPTENEDG